MHRWCAWDLNPGPQNGRRRQNHGAMVATRLNYYYFRACLTCETIYFSISTFHLSVVLCLSLSLTSTFPTLSLLTVASYLLCRMSMFKCSFSFWAFSYDNQNTVTNHCSSAVEIFVTKRLLTVDNTYFDFTYLCNRV